MDVCLYVNVTEVQTAVLLMVIYLEISDTASISGFNLKNQRLGSVSISPAGYILIWNDIILSEQILFDVHALLFSVRDGSLTQPIVHAQYMLGMPRILLGTVVQSTPWCSGLSLAVAR